MNYAAKYIKKVLKEGHEDPSNKRSSIKESPNAIRIKREAKGGSWEEPEELGALSQEFPTTFKVTFNDGCETFGIAREGYDKDWNKLCKIDDPQYPYFGVYGYNGARKANIPEAVDSKRGTSHKNGDFLFFTYDPVLS